MDGGGRERERERERERALPAPVCSEGRNLLEATDGRRARNF